MTDWSNLEVTEAQFRFQCHSCGFETEDLKPDLLIDVEEGKIKFIHVKVCDDCLIVEE